MRKRGYSPSFAAGIIAAGGTLGILLPPSITMILYAVAAEVSLGRLFLAGIGPGLLLVALFSVYAMFRYRLEVARAQLAFKAGGAPSAILKEENISMGDRFAALPRVLPFVILLTGVMIALYGGYATPSETAGLGAVLAFVLIALIYATWRPSEITPILLATLRESTMLMMIIGMSLLYSYVMSYLHLSQAAATWIVDLQLSKWLLLTAILLMVVVLGFFLPPVSITAAQGGGLRPDLVRRDDDHRDGDGPHSPAGWAQHFRHQEHRARSFAERRDLGHPALCGPHGGRGGDLLHLSGDRHLAARQVHQVRNRHT
jgi:C4-dicarboxylate transporter DctM subunit